MTQDDYITVCLVGMIAVVVLALLIVAGR